MARTRSSGTVRSGFTRSHPSTVEPMRWPKGLPVATRKRLSAAATWWPPCRNSTWPIACRSCRPVAGRRWSSSKARFSPGSRCCVTRIMRRPLIAGNWKMHFTVPEGLEYALRLRHALETYANVVDLVILPPAVMLWEIANALRDCPIEVGAQNASWEDQGPFTGEISPKMLAAWCHYLLIGHSERRQLFNETDEQLNRKVQAAFRNKLKVILALGETLEEHDLARTEEVITRQLNAALYGIEVKRAADLTIAYEPVWAIGTGRAATPEYANETMGLIRGLLVGRFEQLATDMRILYGGSVTPANARSLMDQPEIDGALVGGASLKQADFTEIVRAAAELVGLPEGQQGNSEVGHLNIGAGRVVYQDLTRINRAIQDGSLTTNPVLRAAMQSSVSGHALHLMGLVSPGGVHSSSQHLYTLLEMAHALR